MLRIVITAALLGVLAGCAANPDPIIDRRGTDPERFAEDWSECETYSYEVSIAEGTAKGAALGAAVGAAAGAIQGDASQGAGFGGIYGGARSGLDASRERSQVFKRCMSGRGYRVLN